MQSTAPQIPGQPLAQRPDLALAAPLGRLAVLLAATALLLILAACSGSDPDPAAGRITEPVFGVDETGAHYVAIDSCLSCHDNPDAVGGDIYAKTTTYLASAHAIPGTVGADADPACLSCHDPLADGVRLSPWFSGTAMPPGGMTAVGCESCHGAGSHHLAMIPAHPNPAPDYRACGQCHTVLPADHRDLIGPFADNILAKYTASAHVNWALGLNHCMRCHSDEGFRAYAAQTRGMDGAELTAFMADAPAIAAPSPPQCRTCHDGHTGQLRGMATVEEQNGEPVIKYSRLFNLCTSCHQVFLDAVYDPASRTYSYHLDTSKVPYHGELDQFGRPMSSGLVIWDTHFATADGFIPGYFIDPGSETACLLCHDPHAAGKPSW